MSSLTEQQQAAVDLRGASVVLASGAGCGKTHVLTARYLSHLMRDQAAVGQVVAITFTERAAREMRKRIREEIEKLPDSQQHLRDLETAQIATIHSFCGNLLRQYAVTAGLDSGFEVLDDILSTNLRTEAINECLRGLLEADAKFPDAVALRELVVLFGYPAVEEAVDSLLHEVNRPAWEEWLARLPHDIANDWAGPMRERLLPRWVGYLCAASPKISRCLSLLERVQSTNAVVAAKVRGLLDGVPRLHESADLETKVEELCELAKVQGTKKADWPDEATYEAVKNAFTDFRGDLHKRFDVFRAATAGAADAARVGQQFLRVALAADDEYRRQKRRAGVLDFQDLLVLARNLLRDHRDVCDALRERFRFLLLDELQDTDPVQMELIELLCGAGLQHGKLFAVGDHKQSIYRFRGAEVQLFTNLRESVAIEGRLGLTRNYRSQPGVLKFVNGLFARRLEEYESLEAHHEGVGDVANVELLWSTETQRAGDVGPPSARDATEADSLPQGADAHRSQRTFRAAEADAIVRRIVELLADPTPRLMGKDGEPRRVERKDITLLFRSMTNVAVYEAALRRHGLEYYLVGGRAFFAQQEVYDLLNLLRAVENPHDSASLVGALRSPFFNLSDEAIFLLAMHEDGPWAGLHDAERQATLADDQKPAAERAAKWLAAWRALKDRLPIARLLNRVLADTGYDAALQFEFLGDRKLANLWKLVETARTFDRTGLFGLHEFTARLGDLVARQPREEQAATLPEESDVIKLMSIHQAKGSEAPVVFIPDFAAQGRGSHYPVARWHRELGCLVRLPPEFDELPEGELPPFSRFPYDLGRTVDQLADWQEDLRVLYVACTRAKDLLILSAGLPSQLTATDHLPANHWTLALEERFDVRTGRCVATDVKPEDMSTVRVVAMEQGEDDSRTRSDAEAVTPTALPKLPTRPASKFPMILSLPAIEARMRGQSARHTLVHYDTEDDADLAHWRTPRERVGPVSPADGVLWEVLERWNFADADDWERILVDTLENEADRSVGDDVRPKLHRFAKSQARAALAAASDVHRSIEFLADLSEAGNAAVRLKLRGVIDFLYRDAAGWHVLGIDHGSALEDPWCGRQSGLVLQAWAVSKQLGTWPVSIGLHDLLTGQLVQADPQVLSLSGVVEHFLRIAK